MYLFLMIGVLIFAFIAWCAYGAISKVKKSSKVAACLNPDAAQQFLRWDNESNKAAALGRERDAKINRAKALIVAAFNCPIPDSFSGNIPLVCQPGHIESLSDEELDQLINSIGEQ